MVSFDAWRASRLAFDLRAFHDRLLINGAVSLKELGRQVASWMEERE